MLKKVFVLLFCVITVIPSFSRGKKDEEPVQAEVINLPPGKSGDVEGISIEGGRLQVEGDTRDIAFLMDPEESLDVLEEADTFTHSHFKRPDGSIDILQLMDGDELLCWVGDGVRANMGPKGLMILPDEGVDKVKLTTNGKSWSVSLKKETPIVWNNEEYAVFVSKIKKGSMQNQPKFSVDLVIMHK